jgi:crotonobetainyl-CoA:carnitine CoA-transferase CaiB-like acyl-CoA transferase
MMQRIPDFLDDPHLTARGFFRRQTHPRIAQAMPAERGPALFRAVADAPDRPAPLPGEHSREVLARVLDMTDEQIDALIAVGVVEQWAEVML